jgi:hypothetical protein
VRLKNGKINDTVADALREYVCSVIGEKMVVHTQAISEFSRSQGGKFYPIVREFD